MPNIKDLLDELGPSLPKPNVTMRTSASESDWTPEEVKGLRLNPIYTGIGCFMPGSVTDEEWVRGAVRSIKEDGPEQFLVNILHLLRESFAVSDEDSEPEQGVHS